MFAGLVHIGELLYSIRILPLPEWIAGLLLLVGLLLVCSVVVWRDMRHRKR